nr:c-type cytochrome [Aliikangiella sp. G2MR2-5]
MKSHTVKERTKPTGKVYRVGDDVPKAAPVVAATQSAGPRSGEDIYTQKCAACHGTGVAGAPKVGDSGVWVDRIAQGEEVLISHALEGFQGSTGFMPARGTCTDCSDEEIAAAVKHMVANSQ